MSAGRNWAHKLWAVTAAAGYMILGFVMRLPLARAVLCADRSTGGGVVLPPEEEPQTRTAGESSEPDLAALALTEQSSGEPLPPRDAGEGLSAEAARKAAIVENLFHAERRRRKALEAEARFRLHAPR